MRSGFLLVSAGVVAVSVACGLTADFSGLQGGPAKGGADASAALDSGTGASDASDSGVPFCASLPTPVKLCTDFDEGEVLEQGWGATDAYGGAAISLDSVAFSRPGSFLSAVNPSGAPASARLEETLPTDASQVHVEFEMLLVPSDGTFELCTVHEVTSDGTTYGLYYREVAQKLQVQLRSLSADGQPVFDQSWPIGDAPTVWTRVDMDMDISSSGTFTIRHEGTVILSETNQPTSTPSRTALFVELGFYNFAPASAQAHFDNVIIDWPSGD